MPIAFTYQAYFTILLIRPTKLPHPPNRQGNRGKTKTSKPREASSLVRKNALSAKALKNDRADKPINSPTESL